MAGPANVGHDVPAYQGRGTMKENQNTKESEAIQQAFEAFAPLRSAWDANWAIYWRSQGKILGHMQEFARGWFERRHEATKTALELTESLGEANSPNEIMQKVQAWMAGSAQRIAADGLACQKYFVALTGLSAPSTASGETPAAKTSPQPNIRKGTVEKTVTEHAKAA